MSKMMKYKTEDFQYILELNSSIYRLKDPKI